MVQRTSPSDRAPALQPRAIGCQQRSGVDLRDLRRDRRRGAWAVPFCYFGAMVLSACANSSVPALPAPGPAPTAGDAGLSTPAVTDAGHDGGAIDPRRDGLVYGACGNDVALGGSACNPAYPDLVFTCVDSRGDPLTFDRDGAMWESHPCPGGCEDTGRLCDGYQTCENGVAIGDTSCRSGRTDLVFTCVNPRGDANRWQGEDAMWEAVSCPGGCTGRGECDETRQCDNGVPVGGTACNPAHPTRVYVCVDPEGDRLLSDQAGAMWQSLPCPAGCEDYGDSC